MQRRIAAVVRSLPPEAMATFKSLLDWMESLPSHERHFVVKELMLAAVLISGDPASDVSSEVLSLVPNPPVNVLQLDEEAPPCALD